MQYILPFRAAWEAAGGETFVTARDYGITFDLLEQDGVPFERVGASYGRPKWRKVVGTIRRRRALLRAVRSRRPDALVCAGRASLLAARSLGIPSFSIWDYEHGDLTFDRLARAYVVYPDVIDAATFRAGGIRDDRLVPFRGLKEDISFAGLDLASTPTWQAPGDPGLVRVLVRPPAEESHYYHHASGSLSKRLLAHLAAREDTLVVLSPRYPWQAEAARQLEWRNEPVVLDEPVPFVSLLKGMDVVISSGGTMIREAAYLGVPAYSIFQSRMGDVDLHLSSIGRLHLIRSPEEFDRIKLERSPGLDMLRSNPRLLEELTGEILARVRR